MNSIHALVLGIVEGLTEFLPVSSTGHLYLSRQILGVQDSAFTEAFDVIIQSGAMLAVIFYCRSDFIQMTFGLIARDKTQIRRVLSLLVAFLPAGVVGFFLGSTIKAKLFAPAPIVGALFMGGIALWMIEKLKNKEADKSQSYLDLSFKQAFIIGLFQCLALWPGTSRAMATILGARFVGLNSQSSARFSFLLAVPTLLAASGYDLLKNHETIFSSSENLSFLVMGLLASFLSAIWVIQAFVGYLAKNDMKIFAYYRILAALCFYFLLLK